MEQDFKNLNNETKPRYFSKEDIVQGPKKFVFQLQPENVKYIETLSYQQKQELINYLIANFLYEESRDEKKRNTINILKKVILIVLIILIGIPSLIFLANVSINLTKSSYTEMQNNFEKLFKP